jgi:hypothetical protein
MASAQWCAGIGTLALARHLRSGALASGHWHGKASAQWCAGIGTLALALASGQAARVQGQALDAAQLLQSDWRMARWLLWGTGVTRGDVGCRSGVGQRQAGVARVRVLRSSV